jgi:hypothetical protein
MKHLYILISIITLSSLGWAFSVDYAGSGAAPLLPDIERDIEPLDAGMLVLDAENVIGMVYTGEYPKGSDTEHVFNGELWAARDETLCLIAFPAWPDTHFYPDPPSNTELLMSNQTNWGDRPPWVEREGDLDCWTWTVDDRPGYYIGFRLESHGISFAGAQDEDFILFNHRLRNRSDEPITNLYVGWKFDMDVGSPADDAYADDRVNSDPARGLVWMYDDVAANPYLGLTFFGREPSGAAYYDEAGEPHGSGDRWDMLTTTTWPIEDTPGDWRILVNTGLIELAPGEAENFTLAVVAGTDEADLLANADRAAEVYNDIFTGIDDPPRPDADAPGKRTYGFRLYPVRPNPSGGTVVFSFWLPEAGRAELTIYDLSGRVIAKPYAGFSTAGATEVEFAHDLAPGVYVYELACERWTEARKMVVIR